MAIYTWFGELTRFMASNWDSVDLTQPTRKFNIVKLNARAKIKSPIDQNLRSHQDAEFPVEFSS